MATLNKPLRGLLEKTVKEARERAEAGAKAASEALAVPHREPFAHLSPEERELRNRLRAHGRQLGDDRNSKTGEHDIHHLVTECAYEHWHRMLFARFLAENHLLMHPHLGVAVTLEECAELAPEEGAANAWELAGRYAARMLPQIFRPDNPVLHISLAPEHQQELERLLAALPAEVFTAEDSLGWVYQFWQNKRKEEINKSEKKIGAEELPAVTQLFTEPYMVQFLLHNTLGAWWMGWHPGEPLPLEMPYLRLLEDGTPAAGTFNGWPQTAKELKILDPCCGSGHFLVEAFRIMLCFRMQEEGLDPAAASNAVLRDNLFGLEIDERCTQIAAFALALAAWTYPGAGGYRELPPLNIACSGLAVGARKEEWLKLAGADDRLQRGLERIYDLFKDAPTLGSLIDPKQALSMGLFGADWKELQPLLAAALKRDEVKRDCVAIEVGIAAQGMGRAAMILISDYNLVVTNVPYLGFKRFDPSLRKFTETKYEEGKANIATVFLKRSLDLLNSGGTLAIVVLTNWLFLYSYNVLRKKTILENEWNCLSLLGTGAFDSISGEVVDVSLMIITKNKPNFGHDFSGINICDGIGIEQKADFLINKNIKRIKQSDLINNPDFIITIDEICSDNLLSEIAISPRGIVTGDSEKWIKYFWELKAYLGKWRYLQTAVNETNLFDGRNSVIDWSCNGNGMLRPGIDNLAYGKKGIAVSRMGSLPCTIYTGELYDQNTAVIVPNDSHNISALWAFCSSPEFSNLVRKLDKKVNVTPATLIKVPFDLNHWQQIAAEKYSNGLSAPYSNDLTQWIFHGHPIQSEQPLQVAVARLLGYRWPAELDPKMELSDEARAWVQKSAELLPLADDDGIVCLPPVRGERPATERLLEVLAAAYGPEWSAARLTELLAGVGYAGKNLEAWLRDGFFLQHCQLFHQRPFIWHIWDGRKDGFAALVNYHKLDRKTLETLTYTYLGNWLQRQADEVKRQEAGAEERQAAAQALQKELKRILAGEAPYDIFIRWKPLEQQPLGWEPDLNDGVRLNIRPFMTADILRQRPKINWNKDRGKDVESAPWYHLGPQYGGNEGDRINDHHLSLAEKLQARTNSVRT